jgi:hypothetical protein
MEKKEVPLFTPLGRRVAWWLTVISVAGLIGTLIHIIVDLDHELAACHDDQNTPHE